MPPIVWTPENTFELDGTEYISDQFGVRRDHEPTRFCVAKVPRIIDRYAELLADLAPRTIVEVGILEGGSTALFADLARPEKLVAIEYREAPTPKLRDFIQRRGFEDVIAVYGGVDQADTERLQEIMDQELGDKPIDLVVDDASHRLEPSRSTFNCLFPRVRPGGIYLLENWGTGLKADGPSRLEPGERPLVDLVSEIITAKARHPRMVRDITVRSGYATFVRGEDPISEPFDVHATAAG